MQPTKLLYLEDFDVTHAEAKVVAVNVDDDTLSIVLDKTAFYPKGGGQDYDQGTITSADGRQFAVEEVYLDQNGVVSHIGSWVSGELKADDEVNLQVDATRRTLNTRLHSTGHLIDMAVDGLGYGWTPGKGVHYPHMAFVEYVDGGFDAEMKDTYREAIESKIAGYVTAGGQNTIQVMSVDKMAEVCRHVPDNIPSNKPARVVIYNGDFGVPCGGTHVAELSEVGSVTIRKVKKKNGVIRVSYALA